MILSEHRQVVEAFTPKFDSSDEEFDVRRKVRRPTSPKGVVTQAVFDDENNDDVERLARRKSRLLEPHPASVDSPCVNGNNANANRRRVEAAAPRGVPQAQIGEHYGNCIRLAAENKITSKNAFNLHLIDYMSDMLKKEDYASFQIASSSLDAGAKIYAGRVDAVHQETYQVLTGLGRSDKQPTGGADDAEDETMRDTEGLNGRPEQRKKAPAHRDIIQKQLTRIRSKALASKVDVDPLFQHQSSTYDEGGTAELRLNQLSTLDEDCVLILDSSTRVIQSTHQRTVKSIQLQAFLEYIQPVMPKYANQLIMCNSLRDFRFTGWDPSKDTNARMDEPRTPETLTNQSLLDGPDDGYDDYGSDHAMDDFATEPMNQPPDGQSPQHSPHPETSATEKLGVTDSELFVSSLKNMLDKQYEHFGLLNDQILGMWAGPEHWRKKAKRRKFDPVTGLEAENDDDENGETVNTHLVGKSRKTSRRTKKTTLPTVDYQSAKEPGENRTRLSLEIFNFYRYNPTSFFSKIYHMLDPNYPHSPYSNGHLARKVWCKTELSEGTGANSTVFRPAYRQKVGKQMNLLPSQWTDSRDNLYQLCNREVALEASSIVGDQQTLQIEGSGADNLQQPMEAAEFPDWIGGAHPDHMDDHPDSPIGVGDDDYGDDDYLDNEFDCLITQVTNTQGLGELDLISQPRKVARIEIGYARTAKMINVRRLKTAMWTFIESATNLPPLLLLASRSPHSSVASTSSAPDALSLPASSLDDHGIDHLNQQQAICDNEDAPQLCTADSADGQINEANEPVTSFCDLSCSLPSRISWQMAKELSIPIALNCLLHLANEKDLYLDTSDNLADIFIYQGLPQSELDSLKHWHKSMSSDENKTGVAKRPSRTGDGRSKKDKRHRSSTLDDWLTVDADASANDVQS